MGPARAKDFSAKLEVVKLSPHFASWNFRLSLADTDACTPATRLSAVNSMVKLIHVPGRGSSPAVTVTVAVAAEAVTERPHTARHRAKRIETALKGRFFIWLLRS